MTGLDRLPSTDPTPLLRHRDGIYAVDFLTAAVAEFRLFDRLLEQEDTLAGVCQRFGWDERPADVLLTLCLAYGYLEKSEDGVFSTSPSAREHFCEGSPWDLTPYYQSLRDRPVVKDVVRVLATGRPAHWSGHTEASDDWHGSMLSETFARAFTAAMDCRGVYLGKCLADALGDHLGQSRQLLDLAGGSGVYSCALVANFPRLEATVLEQAPVDALAREQVARRGLAARVRVRTGNMFNDPWPEGADVHLFSNVMHDWGVPEIVTLLRRSRENLATGGLVLVHEAFLDPDKKGPVPVAEYSCILAHSTQGRCYSWSEMETFLAEAGFRSLGYRPTGGDRGVVIAR